MKPKNKHAQALAKLSHKVITEKRRENSRANGKKGGRPIKKLVTDATSVKEDGTQDAGFDELVERIGYKAALKKCGR